MTAPAPAPPFPPSADGETVHAYCCQEDVALCGEDLSGGRFGEHLPTCRACLIALKVGRRCGARFCRTRRWLRWAWSR